MFSFGCGIGEPYPLYDISLHVLFFIYLTPESTESLEKSNLFLQSGDTDWRKNSQRTGAKGFQTREVCRRHEAFSPIGISPIGEKFHSPRSP
jgi:hypothetical protein